MTSRYGPDKSRRMLRCRTCEVRSSERKSTPRFNARLTQQRVESMLEHVAEGCGVSQTGRLCWVAPNAVARYSRLAGQHARNAHDDLVAVSPLTTEDQFDERWAFVAEKEAHCDRNDHKVGYWDHLALDPEHRLVLAIVPGARTIENTEALIEELRRRTGGRQMRLMTSDDSPAYETAILHAYGETVTPPRTGQPAHPRVPYQAPSPGPNQATVTKWREKGRVAGVGKRVVFGTVAAVLLAPGMSRASRAINTAFVERRNGTYRHRNARKIYRFSKD